MSNRQSGDNSRHSATGLCIATSCPFDLKSVYSVELLLEDQTLRIEAEGVWQHDDGRQNVVLSGLAFGLQSGLAPRSLQNLIFARSQEITRFLYERTAFSELGFEGAMGLASATRMKSVQAGEFVYRQGEIDPTAGSIYMVVRGRVTLQVKVNETIEAPFVQLGEGELFGGLPVLAGIPNIESAAASENLELLEIDERALRHLRLFRPWLAQKLAATLFRTHAERTSRALARAARCF